MEALRAYQPERDDIEVAAQRERELTEALSYLDRAISRLAAQDYPSRWQSSHTLSPRRGSPSHGFGSALHRYVAAAFGTGRRAPSIASPSPR
jgi:hypothetical protein